MKQSDVCIVYHVYVEICNTESGRNWVSGNNIKYFL
jgi:hypothetical protein